MSSPELSKFEQMKASGDLPSPKGVALTVIRMTQRDDVSVAELSQVVRTDPAFVGRLIKAANSCNVGLRRPVVSIQEALTLLGLPTVRSLALGFSLISAYRSGNCRNFNYERYWSQSLVRAIALQAIASRTYCMAPEEAFSVGLLANIGELALATIYPDAFSKLLGEDGRLPRKELLIKEREAFALDSVTLTAAMLQDWGFPKTFISTISLADHPEHSTFIEGSRNANILQSLLLAFYISDVCMASEEEQCLLVPQLYLLGGRMAMDAASVTNMCDEVAREWQEWGTLLSVDTEALPSFAELAKARVPVSAATNEAAPAATKNPDSMRVLIADDDASMRAVLSALLSKAGHEVFVATNGRQAFEMALDLYPQIMVVDWMMPEMDGLELTIALRQTKVGRAVYLILLTGIEDDNKLVAAFDAGVDDFIAKPLKPRVLEARLRAGQRVVALQQEIERDRLDVQRFAAELAVTNRRLHEMAQTDALTGLPNRRYAIERAAQEWADSVRSGRSLICMVIDIDGFKQINDQYGHDAGDVALQAAAATIKNALRVHDVVCRMGGDEFMVLCPDTSLEDAMQCAERIRAAVAVLDVANSGGKAKIGVSIGIAERDEDMGNPDDLIKEADRGVYIAKERGRNLCVVTQLQWAEQAGDL